MNYGKFIFGLLLVLLIFSNLSFTNRELVNIKNMRAISNKVQINILDKDIVTFRRVSPNRHREIFAKVHPANHSELFIVGHDGVETKITDNEFLGHVKQDALIKHMSESNFFLLMSRKPSERLPTVVKEAMFQQCVVVTTATEGIHELVESGISGFVVKMGDYTTASTHILTCIAEPQTCREIASTAKGKISKDFNVNKKMKQYVDFWHGALKK